MRAVEVLTAVFAFPGILLSAIGIGEWLEAGGASLDPVSVSLGDLDRGADLPDRHVTLGRHFALYDESVARFVAPEVPEEPGHDERIKALYYPIVSPGYRAEAADFRVLVMTSRFATLGDVPSGTLDEPGLTGLVSGRTKPLRKPIPRLLRESFPGLDLDRVLLLVQDRHPIDRRLSALMLLGGMLLLAVAVKIVRIDLRRRRSAASASAAGPGHDLGTAIAAPAQLDDLATDDRPR
jgi:hypothetical protein